MGFPLLVRVVRCAATLAVTYGDLLPKEVSECLLGHDGHRWRSLLTVTCWRRRMHRVMFVVEFCTFATVFELMSRISWVVVFIS